MSWSSIVLSVWGRRRARRADDVGLDVHRVGDRHYLSDVLFDTVDRISELGEVEIWVEGELGADQELLRAEVLSAQMDHVADVGGAQHGIPTPLYPFVRRP